MIDKSADLKSSFSSFICDRCSLLLRQECVYFWLADSNSKKLQDLESLQLKIKINFLFCYIFAGSRNQSQRDLSDTEGKLPAPRRACQSFFFLSAHTQLTSDANDFVSTKEKVLLARHLSPGFSPSRKRAVFRGTKVSDEKYVLQKRQSNSLTGEQNLQQTRQCGKVVEAGLITTNTAPDSPQTMQKWLQVQIQPEHRLKNACYQQFGSIQRTETTRQQRPAAMA